MPESVQVFLCGCFGSAAIELARALRTFETGRVPKRYKSAAFWLLRALYAMVSGLMALLYETDNLAIAFHIGVATPVILTQLAQQRPTVTAASGSEGGD